MYVCMHVYSLYKEMEENHNHKYTSLTDLLDLAQKKPDPVLLDGNDDDDDDDDGSNYGPHGCSDGRYSFIMSNNSSSVLDPSKSPLLLPPAPAPAPVAAVSSLHDDDDDDDDEEEEDEVKKKLWENNNNCCKYDESAKKLLFSVPIFSCLMRNKAAVPAGCPCVYRQHDEQRKTIFIPETVFLPHDIMAASSSSADHDDHQEKGKKGQAGKGEGHAII